MLSFSIVGSSCHLQKQQDPPQFEKKEETDNNGSDGISLIRIISTTTATHTLNANGESSTHKNNDFHHQTLDTKKVNVWINQAEDLLSKQWPRDDSLADKHKNAQQFGSSSPSSNSSISSYREKIIYQQQQQQQQQQYLQFPNNNHVHYVLPCSYLLMLEGDNNVIGHGRLTECFESAGGNAVAATFIVIDSKYRGLGLGSKLMQLLEDEAVRLGYHYMYLWTQTAITFYENIGYQKCHRVSLVRPCLKSLQANQVDTLEAMLFQKLNKGNNRIRKKETIMLPPSSNESTTEINNEDVWLRRRLVEHEGSIQISLQDRLEEIREVVMAVVKEREDSMRMKTGDSKYVSTTTSWFYRLVSLPWQRQIGPSCGLAALRMVREYFNEHGQNLQEQHYPSLLSEAQQRGYTDDGEIFDIEHLQNLANEVCGIPNTKLWHIDNRNVNDQHDNDIPGRSITPYDIDQVLANDGVLVIPYDSKPGMYVPVSNYNGQRAHYGIIVGILIGIAGVDDDCCHSNHCKSSNQENVNLKLLDRNDASTKSILNTEQPKTVYLVVQHSLSSKLIVAAFDDFMESNHQLLTLDADKFAESKQNLNLKDRILVLSR